MDEKRIIEVVIDGATFRFGPFDYKTDGYNALFEIQAWAKERGLNAKTEYHSLPFVTATDAGQMTAYITEALEGSTR